MESVIGELNVDCITDASYAFSKHDQRVPLLGSAQLLAEHDLNAVKPALLYADRVTLYSGNPFIAAQIKNRRLRLSMGIPALSMMEQLATSGLRDINGIEIPIGIIPDSEEFKEFANRQRNYAENASEPDEMFWKKPPPIDHDNARAQELTMALQKWNGEIKAFSEWINESLAREQRNLFSPELEIAVQSGLLQVRGHLDYELEQDADAPIGLLQEELLEEYSADGAIEMFKIIAAGDSAIMLDEWSNDLIAEFGPGKKIQSSVDQASLVGVRMLSQFPRVQNASISELIDLRQELSSPLIRLRAAIVSSTQATQSGTSNEDLDEIVRTLLVSEIAPSLLEIEEARRENSYISNLLSVTTDPKQLIAPILSLAVSIGLQRPIFTAVAAAVGLSGPQLKAAWNMSQTEKQIQKMKFFFLHRISE